MKTSPAREKTADIVRLYRKGWGHKGIAWLFKTSPRIVRVILIEQEVWKPGSLMHPNRAATVHKMTPQNVNQPKPWTAEKIARRKEHTSTRTRKVADLPLFVFGSAQQHKRTAAAYVKERRANDITFKVKGILRLRILAAVKSGAKSGTTMELIGCSIDEFKKHIESTFQNGMTWANFRAWQIDHIRPCASFDLTQESEQRACFHFTNTQALWRIDNLKKKDKWNPN